MQSFCEALPEDRLLQGSEHDLDSLLQKEEGKRTYKISATGAQLTYHSAMAILARYASSLVRIIISVGLYMGSNEGYHTAIRKGNVDPSYIYNTSSCQYFCLRSHFTGEIAHSRTDWRSGDEENHRQAVCSF